MDPDIRPQDDLFGHVNGRWLEETEIPSDKSSWGAFIALADAAEQQVRDIITELADRPADQLDADERKIGDLYASFMDTDTIAAKGLQPIEGLLDRARRLEDLTGLAAFLGDVRAHRRPRPLRLLHHPRPRRRLEEHRLPRPGRARPARRVLLPRRQVRGDPLEVRRLPHHAAHPQPPRRPGRRRRPRPGLRDPRRRGPLGGRGDARRPEDHQPQDARRAPRAVPGLRLGHLRHRPSAAPRRRCAPRS